LALGKARDVLPKPQPGDKWAESWLLPLCWIGSSVTVLLLDLQTGPFLQFPVFFVLPVLLSSWFSSNRWGVALAVCLPLVRLSFFAVWGFPYSPGIAVTNAAVRVLVLVVIALLAGRAAERTRALESHVRILEGIVPICGFCKRMREEDGRWVRLEEYIGDRSEARFSHGVCQECALEQYGWVLKQ
jgi:hypothetical protein